MLNEKIWCASGEINKLPNNAYVRQNPGLLGTPTVHKSVIDLFHVIVFIQATNHVITIVMPHDQTLWMAKTFPVPLIPIDSS